MAGPRSGQPRTPRSGNSGERDPRLDPPGDRRTRPAPGSAVDRPATDPQVAARTDPQGEPAAPQGAGQPYGPADAASVGELIGEVTSDLTRLVRNEFQLAKAELKEEGAKAGKAAGLYGGAGYAAGLTLLLASLAAVYGLAHLIDPAWAALVVAAVWAVAGAVLYTVGRKRMRSVQPTPERARDSLREDVKWARHPTS